METYTVHTQQGNIIINQINYDDAIIWHVPLSPNGLKLNGEEMEKLAKALFKMSRKLKNNNSAAIPQQPVNIPMNMQTPSMTTPATPNRMEITKSMYQRAYAPWTQEEMEKLILLYQQGVSINEIAGILHRNEGGITSRLKKLGLMN
jgi:hypothetical protein